MSVPDRFLNRIAAIKAQVAKRVFYINIESDEAPEVYLRRLRERYRNLKQGSQN